MSISIQDAQNKEQLSFVDIYSRYKSFVTSCLLGMVRGDITLAEDLTQEVFLKVYRALPAMNDANDNLKGWLYRIAQNTVFDTFRHQRTAITYMSDYALLEQGMERRERDPQEIYEMKELLYLTVLGIPDHLKLVLLLFSQEDLSYKDIASRLGLSVPTVKSRIARARIACRGRLHAIQEEKA